LVIIHRFVAMWLTAMWHLHFVLEKKKAGGGELADLGTSSPVSIRSWLWVVGDGGW